MAREKDNPGLQAYDLSSYTGLRGKNFYKVDRTIQRIVERYSEGYTPEHKKAMISHLEGYGELVGGKLDELTEACHKEGKYG
ncbi:MAG: acyl-CoA dehydrogenase, partial [Leptospiraceae bacterium]|nr:acyl-CoA dehydrogenase [Leptospiraceae bacterium]